MKRWLVRSKAKYSRETDREKCSASESWKGSIWLIKRESTREVNKQIVWPVLKHGPRRSRILRGEK